MKRYLPFYLLTTLIASMCAAQGSSGKTPTVEQDLKSQLVGRVIKLRVPAAGSKLNFDSSGMLVSKFEPGIRGVDGEFQISSVKLRKNVVVLHGERGIDIYDPAKHSVSIGALSLPVRIAIEFNFRLG